MRMYDEMMSAVQWGLVRYSVLVAGIRHFGYWNTCKLCQIMNNPFVILIVNVEW